MMKFIGLIHNSKSGGESGDGEESTSLQGNAGTADHQDHRMRQTVPLSSSVDYVNWYHSCVRYPVVQCVALLFVRFSSTKSSNYFFFHKKKCLVTWPTTTPVTGFVLCWYDLGGDACVRYPVVQCVALIFVGFSSSSSFSPVASPTFLSVDRLIFGTAAAMCSVAVPVFAAAVGPFRTLPLVGRS